MGIKQELVISRYKIESNTPLHLRIVLVSDLHDEDGSSIVNIIESLSPDIILIPGDIIETYNVCLRQLIKDEYQIYLRKAGKKATDQKFQSLYITRIRFPKLYFITRIFIHLLGTSKKALKPNNKKYGENFFKSVRNIAPCYFSRGNHDAMLKEVPKGIKLLENEHVVINIAGKNIAIGGISKKVDLDWLDEFEQVPAYHILLCHYPELYEPLLKNRRIELIVSGHAHGGQIRIGARGLYAPGQGLFPKYTKGVYDNRFVVTTGLCNNGVIPRYGNPTEVVFIEI